MSRPFKRTRRNPNAYFDELDDGDDDDVSYQDIHVREGRLKKTGLKSLPIRVAVLDDASSAWMNMTSWKVNDDTDFALDPCDGQLYEEAVDRHVMDDTEATSSGDGVHVEKKRYIRSQVSVSLLLSVHFLVLKTNIF